MTFFIAHALGIFAGIMAVKLAVLFEQRSQHTPIRDISFSELLTQTDQSRVHDVTILGNELNGCFSDNHPFAAQPQPRLSGSDHRPQA